MNILILGLGGITGGMFGYGLWITASTIIDVLRDRNRILEQQNKLMEQANEIQQNALQHKRLSGGYR